MFESSSEFCRISSYELKDKEGNESEKPECGSGKNDFDCNDALRYGLFSIKEVYI